MQVGYPTHVACNIFININSCLCRWSLEPTLICKSPLTTNNLKWILLCPGMWHVVLWQCTRVSEDSAAYIFTKFEEGWHLIWWIAITVSEKSAATPSYSCWRWRVQVSLKWRVSIKLYHVTSQNILLLILNCRKYLRCSVNRSSLVLCLVCSGGDGGGLCCAIPVSCLVSIFLNTILIAIAENWKEKLIWISVNR